MSGRFPQQRRSETQLPGIEFDGDNLRKVSFEHEGRQIAGTLESFAKSRYIDEMELRFVPDDEIRILTRREFKDTNSHKLYYAQDGTVYTQEVTEKIGENDERFFWAHPVQHVTRGDIMAPDSIEGSRGIPAGSALLRLRLTDESRLEELELPDVDSGIRERYRRILDAATGIDDLVA